jgi:hypothetical protein
LAEVGAGPAAWFDYSSGSDRNDAGRIAVYQDGGDPAETVNPLRAIPVITFDFRFILM